MKDFITNPWTVTVGGGVIVGAVIYKLFGGGKVKKRTAIRVRGNNATIKGNAIEGYDTAIDSQGKNTRAENNKIH